LEYYESFKDFGLSEDFSQSEFTIFTIMFPYTCLLTCASCFLLLTVDYKMLKLLKYLPTTLTN